jgi:hypothetical protein
MTDDIERFVAAMAAELPDASAEFGATVSLVVLLLLVRRLSNRTRSRSLN